MESKSAPWYWSDGNMFSGIAADVEQEFFNSSQRLEYKKNQKIFGPDDTADYVYVLHQGLVKIYDLSPSGVVTVFWFCGPGALFGAGGISGSPRQSVSAQAMKHSVVFSASRLAFERLIEANPRIGLNVISMLGARLRLACDAAMQRTTIDVTARLSRLLLQLAHGRIREQATRDGAHEIDRIEVGITQQDLADMAGIGRQTANGALGQLRKAGLIDTQRGKVFVLSMAKLQAYYAAR